MSQKSFSANIVGGHFTSGTGKKGNFYAEDEIGDNFFISKKLMASIKITKDSEFKPFFAIIKEKEVGVRDEETGDIIKGAKNLREEATKVFLKEEDRDLAMISRQLGQIKRQKLVENKANEAELTKESLRAILSSSSFI